MSIKRILFGVGIGVIVLVVAFGALLGYLGTANHPPRRVSTGWSRVANLPRARGEFAAAEVKGKPGGLPLCPRTPCPDDLVYALGGLTGPLGRTLDEVDVYDPPTNSWKKAPSLPEPRHHLAAAVVGESLYVTGGSRSTTSLAPEANVWVLGPGRLSWQRLVQMPEPRTAHSMVAVGDQLYVLGGRGKTSDVLIYDTTKGAWKTGAAMPAKRDHATAVAVDTKIYVLGGRSNKVTKRVDIYDTVADSWSQGPDMPLATSGASAAFLNDHRIHVVGGEDPRTIGGGVRDAHFALDPVSGTWSILPPPLLAVHGAGYAEVGGRLLIIGGARRQGTLSVLGFTGFCESFDPGEASQLPASSPTPTPRSRKSTSAPPATALPS